MANTDQTKGFAKKITGVIKEAAGRLTGKRKTEEQGRQEQVKGEAQKTVGDVKNKV